MADDNPERGKGSPYLKDILLILIGTFIASGFQAFQTLMNLWQYPQLFPQNLNFLNYGITEFLLFVFSFGLAWWVIRKIPSVVQGGPNPPKADKVDGEANPPKK